MAAHSHNNLNVVSTDESPRTFAPVLKVGEPVNHWGTRVTIVETGLQFVKVVHGSNEDPVVVELFKGELDKLIFD